MAEPQKPTVKRAEKDTRVAIVAPRYIDGEYVPASPESPAVLVVKKGEKLDAGMKVLEGSAEPEVEVRAPHFNAKSRSDRVPSAVESGKSPL